jgi:VWFA-related protein
VFTISQDGVNQKIDFFAAIEEPLNVGLLIDTSQSTRGVLDEIKDAATNFVKLLRLNDKATIVSFDYATHVLSPLTSDAGQLRRAINRADVPEYFGTTLRDAVAETIKKQFAGVTGRKAVILLTDGKDAGSRISADEIIVSLQESDVIVYTVFFKTDLRQIRPGFGNRRGGVFGERFPRRRRERAEQQNERAEEFLQELSEVTAGRFYESESSKLKETFGLIVEELRHQYRLGFYPPEEKSGEGVHTLRVQVSRPNVAVRARSNYRVKTQ